MVVFTDILHPLFHLNLNAFFKPHTLKFLMFLLLKSSLEKGGYVLGNSWNLDLSGL